MEGAAGSAKHLGTLYELTLADVPQRRQLQPGERLARQLGVPSGVGDTAPFQELLTDAPTLFNRLLIVKNNKIFYFLLHLLACLKLMM